MERCPQAGLIPARAGNTEEVAINAGGFRAHPRSRGEHQVIELEQFAAGGSSPLARGTLIDVSEAFSIFGLIPARAGNTREGKCTW